MCACIHIQMHANLCVERIRVYCLQIFIVIVSEWQGWHGSLISHTCVFSYSLSTFINVYINMYRFLCGIFIHICYCRSLFISLSNCSFQNCPLLLIPFCQQKDRAPFSFHIPCISLASLISTSWFYNISRCSIHLDNICWSYLRTTIFLQLYCLCLLSFMPIF